ncbi:MAG TPA: hypothetical protein ENJ06_02000 [Phycisphaeraceae bacterium]|nr:hypothetical protein [Phycisphaeraceae bacterium]
MRYQLKTAMILCGTLLINLSTGCTVSHTSSNAENVGLPAISQYGTMREVLRDGHTEARISMTDAVAEPHAYAVGALEGLTGEIMIVDGNVWVARNDGDNLQVTGPTPDANDKATLLALTHVTNWKSETIKPSTEGQELESLIEHMAREQGLDTSQPVPFLLEGKTGSINLHVINGYCPIRIDPATMDVKPWRLSVTNKTDVVIFGYYAPNSAGVLTHHGTSIHAHALIRKKGRTLTGHVDQVTVEPGMILKIPGA